MGKDTWETKIQVWFKEGDWNIGFFHHIANTHRCHNLVAKAWAGEEEMKQEVTKFYKDYIRR